MALAFSPDLPGIFLLLVLSGQVGNDIVSLVPLDDYFKSRGIETSVAKMMELAGTDPVDGKSSLQQLLALRFLAEDADRVKKADGFARHLKLLEDIAAGKKAKDRLGFSMEYAAWAVARFTGKPLVLAARAPGKLADSSLGWFPEKTSLLLAAELGTASRPFGQSQEIRELTSRLAREIPAKTRADIYKAIEDVGNVRVDRLAIAVLSEDGGNRNVRFYWRISGKGDLKRLSDTMAAIVPNAQIEKEGDKNDPILILKNGLNDAAMAFLGDSEVILGMFNRGMGRDGTVLLREMLSVRAGKAPSVLKGDLAGELKKVSSNAQALLVGTLYPPELDREFGPPNGPFSALPSAFVFDAERQKDGIAFHAFGKMAKNEQAKAFIEDALKLRGQAMIMMKLDKDSPIPFDGVLKMLSTMKLEAKEDTVVATMRLSNEIIASYIDIGTRLLKGKGGLE